MPRLSLLACLLIVGLATAADPKGGTDWWALQPLKQKEPPLVAGITDPIDRFVTSRLEKEKLTLSPQADKQTLIRRLSYDLTGLPPTPNEIADFLKDASPDAYAKLVDRLLASPAYGERWGRHWLDVARFTESHGFEYDRLRENAWRYRDYVIQSFNDDLPYSQFVRDQLAGDVNPKRVESLAATGFLVSGPFDQPGATAASPIVRLKAREDEMEEMVGTVSQTFLGVTMNCARCHDHKVDPYSAVDYYRMKAVFDGVRGGDRELITPERKAIRGERIKALETEITQLDKGRQTTESLARQRVRAQRKQAAGGVDDVPQPISRWSFDRDGRDSVGELALQLKEGARIERGRLILNGQGAFAVSVPFMKPLQEKTLEAWVSLADLQQVGGGAMTVQTLRGEVFDGIVYGEKEPRQWIAGSNFFQRTRDVRGSEERALSTDLIHLAITYANDGRITLYRNGKPYGESYLPEGQTAPVSFPSKDSQVLFGLRHKGAGRGFLKGEIDEARLYDRSLTPAEIEASYQGGPERISAVEWKAALTPAERDQLTQSEKKLIALRSELDGWQRTIMAYAATAPRPVGETVVYKRGEVERPGKPVTAGTPAIVKGPPPLDLAANSPEGERRRHFAEWIVHPDNPLTWRVIVNRVWQYHFGAGLVRSSNDFGYNGEPASHPELLDWLAMSFRDQGGSFKKLHRQIVLSRTYQQASTPNEKALALDADDQLLWRFPPRRLEAEAIRDTMLQVSGQLNKAPSGQSTRPFRVENFNSSFYILFDSDKPEFNRRSVYRMNVNSAKDPLLDVFDCPDPSTKTPKRSSTTTPLQALTMMNSVFMERLSRAFANRVVKEAGPNPIDQAALSYRLAYGREATQVEKERAARVIQETNLKAVCWALMNSSEFIYVR